MLGFTNKIQANSLLVYYLLMENSKRKRGISLSHHFIHNDNPNIVQSRVRRVDLLKSPITTSNPINLRPKSLHKPHVTFSFASPSPQNSQPRWSYQPSSQRTSINTSHNKNFSIQDNTLDTSSPFSSVLNETRERYNHSEIKKVFFGEKLMKVYPVNEIKKEQVDKRQNKIGEILTSKQVKISNYSEKKPQRLQIYNKIVDLPIQRQQQSNNFSNIHLDKIIQANQIKKNSQASKRFKRSQDLMTLKQMQKKLKQIISVCNKH